MPAHYFSRTQTVPSQPFEIRATVRGRDVRLMSDRGVFSATRLDRGTRLLLETAEFRPGEAVLDLGCGYGVVGVFAGLEGAGQVVMVDINPRAAGLAHRNLEAHGLAEVALAMVADGASALGCAWADTCLLNPPIRAGREVVRSLIEGGGGCLKPGGRLLLVARTSQGVKSLAKVMTECLSQVEEIAKGGGFRVLGGTAS